jgi:hypothetical protein
MDEKRTNTVQSQYHHSRRGGDIYCIRVYDIVMKLHHSVIKHKTWTCMNMHVHDVSTCILARCYTRAFDPS